MKYDQKYCFITSIFTSLTIFSGAVNHGLCSFLTYPSYLVAIFIFLLWGNKYRIFMLLTFILSIFLHLNNKSDNKLFFPAVGEEIITTRDDLCANSQYIFKITKSESCENQGTKIKLNEKGRVVKVSIDQNFLQVKHYVAEIEFDKKIYTYFPSENEDDYYFKMGNNYLNRTTMENQFFNLLSLFVWIPFSLIAPIRGFLIAIN